MQACLLPFVLYTSAPEPLAPETLIVDSPHQAALRGEIVDDAPITVSAPSPARSEPGRVKSGVVYGYFPSGYALDKIKGWDQLTHIVWFGPTINSSGTMGNTAGLGGANYQTLREQTRAKGIQLVIGFVNFNTAASPSSVATLLANRATAVATIKKQVEDYDADGASLDFEVVPESSKAAYVSFLADLSAALHALNPNHSVSSAIPPPTGWKGYDYIGILQNSDLAFVMAYDYHWSGAPQAGPVTPKNNTSPWAGLNLETSLDKLDTDTGALKAKLVIGLPWYGYSWPTSSTSVPSSTVSRPEAPAYAPTMASGKSRIQSGSYDQASEQPYAAYYDSYGPRQMWLDDVASFTGKMDMVKEHGFGGIGMFQLGYEGDEPALWEAISERYSTAPVAADAPPTATLVAPAQAVVNEEIALDASASTDPEGQPLLFSWTADNGAIFDADKAKAILTVSSPCTVTVTLTVSDAGNSVHVQKQIQVLAAEQANTIATDPTTTVTTAPGSTTPAPVDALGRQSNIGRPGEVKQGCRQGGDKGGAWGVLLLLALFRARRRPVSR